MGPVGRNGDLYGVVVEDPYLGRTPGPGVRVLPLAAGIREHRNTENTSPNAPKLPSCAHCHLSSERFIYIVNDRPIQELLFWDVQNEN